MPTLAITFWNHGDSDHQSTTFHIVDDGDATSMSKDKGMSIAAFFKRQDISLQKFIQTFPGYVIPNELSHIAENDRGVLSRIFSLLQPRKPSWDDPLMKQSIPDDRESIERLSRMIGMPVTVYRHWHRSEAPQLQFSTS